MNRPPPLLADVPDEMFEHAVMWRQRMENAEWSAEDEAELEDWLQADERHARAFRGSGQVWSFFEQHTTSPELIGAHRALLGRVQKQAVGRWSGTPAALRMPSRRVAAGVVAAMVVASVGIWPIATEGQAYQSGVGERRVITLQDGSVLTLDARSRVTVRYSKGARRLTLQRGQARFDVAHDPARPFTVAVRDQTVVATGTAFNIDMIKPEVRVTLIEGRVLVLRNASALHVLAPPARTSKPVELRAGQALVTPEDGAPQQVQAADITRATAWQDGKLTFDGEPLAEAVERINRYTNRTIRVADAKAAAIPVYGEFDTGNVDGFIEAVNGFLPVRAIQGTDGVTLQSTAPAG